MNAVNLIPVERRQAGLRGVHGLPGAPFLGLVGGLLLVLAGTVAYQDASNGVSTRQGELSHVQAAATAWSAAASRYAPAVTELAARDKQFSQLGGLLGQRYDWSALLGQLAGVMPADSQLSSLSATDASAVPSASAGTAVAPTSASTGSGITLAGCATSQSVVADTMVALRRLSGVSEVTLSSSTNQPVSSGSGDSSSAGSCGLPIDFNLSLEFAPAATAVGLRGVTSTPSGSGGTESTTTTTASASDSVGGAQ